MNFDEKNHLKASIMNASNVSLSTLFNQRSITMIKRLLFLSLLLISSTLYAVDCQQVRQTYNCPGTEKYPIHLSFDDGPAIVTPKVLDALKQHNIKATFFIIAEHIDCQPLQQKCFSGTGTGTQQICADYKQCLDRTTILQRVKKEGHMIGSHSYSHVHHSQIPPSEMIALINKSRSLLTPYFTTYPPVFRLPFGDGWFNRKEVPHVLEAVEKKGFKHIDWNMSAFDWKVSDQEGDKILATSMKQICQQKHGTILFHDGDFEKKHIGRTFTADNMAKWIDAMSCVADFKPLTYIYKDLKIR